MSDSHQPVASQRTQRGPLKQAMLIFFGLIAAALAVASAWQILAKAFEAADRKYADGCNAGTARLYSALVRAKDVAANSEAGERSALPAFRKALLPEWNDDKRIRRACRIDSSLAERNAFRAVELLRYAEERAVRFEAVDLSRLRRQAPELLSKSEPQPEKK